MRIAGLDQIEFGPGNWLRPTWIRVTVVPCASHDRSTWDRYEDRLCRRLRYGSSTWLSPDDDPNVMAITLRRRPLPTLWSLADINPALLTGSTAELPFDGRRPGEHVYLGMGADGSDMTWSPDEPGKAMLFIGGRQGGGKGVLARSILARALTCGWRIRVCNPKRVGEFRWLGASASVAKIPSGMFAMIHDFRAELERRADLLDEIFGVADWTDVPLQTLDEHEMAHRELLVIDEFVTLMTMKGLVPPIAPPPSAPKGTRPLDPYAVMVGDLQAIAAMGRALGMSLVLLTQHPIAEHMGPFGSTVKANMGAKIGVGSLEAEGAGSLFGKGQGEAIYQILRGGIPGRCVYEGLTSTDTGSWKLGQALYASATELAALVPAEPVHLPVDYDRPHPAHDTEEEAA